jgi:diaminohydroxyphosphoribosylaminopyrimidine deaminase / 5-amino-6-(5-phosphoribosylamino)uracil reductase
MFSDLDTHHMQRALELAELGRYSSQPNPRVGCVIAHGAEVVGEGSHLIAGQAHAEANALKMAGERARGATAYVTLEPHCFHGKTPPCTDALIRAGIKRVVCGVLDPNPKVSGEGIRQLQAAGIETQVGLLEPQARELNAGFEKRMRFGLPRVIVKLAASLDGRTALSNGASKWITGEAARVDVQRLRAECGAIVTGINTVLADDPQMNVRDDSIDMGGRQPLKVIVDSNLRTPIAARISAEGSVLIATSAADIEQRRGDYAKNVELLEVAALEEGRVDLHAVVVELGRRQCNDVLVEAGPTLAGRFVAEGLADVVIVYVAPVALGDAARPLLHLPRLERMDGALQFILKQALPIGRDLKLTYVPQAR